MLTWYLSLDNRKKTTKTITDARYQREDHTLEWLVLASILYVSSRLMLFPNAKMAATRINPKKYKTKNKKEISFGACLLSIQTDAFSLSLPLLFFFINNSAQKKSGHLFFLKKRNPSASLYIFTDMLLFTLQFDDVKASRREIFHTLFLTSLETCQKSQRDDVSVASLSFAHSIFSF